MIEETNQKSFLPLKVLDFEVHAVYGVQFQKPSDSTGKKDWKTWFENKMQERSPFREGWTPIYRDHCTTITIDIKTPNECKNIEVVHPAIFCKKGEQLFNPSQSSTVKMEVSRCLTIRDDGVAAVSIRLKADKKAKSYNLADVLASLLLAPRIRSGTKLHSDNEEVKAVDEISQTTSDVYKCTAEADALSNEAIIDTMVDGKSPLFKLFLGALKELLSKEPKLIWNEYHVAGMTNSDPENSDGERSLPTNISKFIGDQQIPYFVVFATLPEQEYKEAFLERGAEKEHRDSLKKARQKYTRQIGAILLRWLSPHNAEFVSIDYLESLGLVKDGVFVNQYMNSLSFVSYSSIATLCLKADRESDYRRQELDPQEATYGSILRCVELSRIRLHHAFRLNIRLDELTKKVINHVGFTRFEKYLAELLRIRDEAAHHFLDPLTYQWDATVGADLASFLHIDVIESIESECLQKLDMVKKLYLEKLDVMRARAMRGDDPDCEIDDSII